MIANQTPARRWLGRIAIGGWLGLGIVVASAAPEPQPMAPEVAEGLFGDKRSVQSSAKAGLFAFGSVIEKLGYSVEIHGGMGAPDADVLVMLEPMLDFEPVELDGLINWVSHGGRLIYAQTWLKRSVLDALLEDDGDGAAAESGAVRSHDDPLVQRLVQEAREPSEQLGAVELFVIGVGKVAVLPEGGAIVSNASLEENGIVEELPWLRRMLAGMHTVAFDEGRQGQVANEGMLDLIGRSRFAAALQLAMLALLVWLVARSVRRVPAQAEPIAGARVFGEFLDALATLLTRGERVSMAREALLSGSGRRLGALSASPRAREVFAGVKTQLDVGATPTDVARQAEALRRLESELLDSR